MGQDESAPLRGTLKSGLAALRRVIHGKSGPNFAAVKAAVEKLPLVLPPHDGELLKSRLCRALPGASADVLPEKL
jgi:hypothetical protein